MRFSSLFFSVGLQLSSATGNAAVDKVVTLLKEMNTKGVAEKQQEAVMFAAFDTWCSNTQAEKTDNIKAGELAIKEYESKIERGQANNKAALIGKDAAVAAIAKSNELIDTWTKRRTAGRNGFVASDTELADSITACDSAMVTLSAVPQQVATVTKLLQIQFKRNKNKDIHHSAVEALIAAGGAPSYASERRGDSVIKMLEELKQKFVQEKQEKSAAEGADQHQHEMDVQRERLDIADNEKLSTDYTNQAAEAAKSAADAKKALTAEQKSMKDTKAYLGEVKNECTLKKKDFDERQKSRSDELAAIAQAITILNGAEVGAGVGHLNRAQSVGKFLQSRKKAALVQKRMTLRKVQKVQKRFGLRQRMNMMRRNKMRTVSLSAVKKSKNWENNVKIASFLRTSGVKINSNLLVQLADAATADPFVKVREMVQSLINRLEEQHRSELEHKGFCDENMARIAANIVEFTAKVDKLTSTIETLTSEIALEKKNKKNLETELSQLNTDLNKANAMRVSESAMNQKTIAESKTAETALGEAIAVLEDYYRTNGLGLIQKPEFAAGSYEAMSSDGVIGLLEVVKSQTAKLILETTSAEAAASQSHNQFREETEATIASKTQTKNATEISIASKDNDLTDAKDELNGENGAANQLANYKEQKVNIDAQCTHSGVSFEERSAKRKDEIEALGKALEILGNMS